MKVLVLNGSPRADGNTKAMVEAFKKGAEGKGNEVAVFLGTLDHVSHVEKHIGITQRTAREAQHRLLELVVRFQHTRGVREHNLRIIGIQDAHNAVTGSLRLECGDRNPLAHQKVHKGRLTHIGVTHNIYKTGFMHTS